MPESELHRDPISRYSQGGPIRSVGAGSQRGLKRSSHADSRRQHSDDEVGIDEHCGLNGCRGRTGNAPPWASPPAAYSLMIKSPKVANPAWAASISSVAWRTFFA